MANVLVQSVPVTETQDTAELEFFARDEHKMFHGYIESFGEFLNERRDNVWRFTFEGQELEVMLQVTYWNEKSSCVFEMGVNVLRDPWNASVLCETQDWERRGRHVHSVRVRIRVE